MSKSWTGTERRERTPKPRKLNERRRDMLILSSATHTDIYLWALSLVVMGIILGVFLAIALLGLHHG